MKNKPDTFNPFKYFEPISEGGEWAWMIQGKEPARPNNKTKKKKKKK